MPTTTTTSNVSSVLNFVEVAEIRDNTLILREGQMRSIIMVSSANFALKSIDEQDRIIGSFQGFLNSLDTPIQILVQSRKLDLSNYIEKLKILEEKQENDLLRVKMQEYIEYIDQMLNEINIMNKDFFVVVGHEPITLKTGLFGKVLRALNPANYIKQKEGEFQKNRKILHSRSEQISSSLGSLGLTSKTLTTEELIALMYNSYNPDTSESIKIQDIAAVDLSDYSPTLRNQQS